MSREQFILTLEPTPQGPPAEIRLRRALKTLLRSFGLRCVNIQENNGDATGRQRAAQPNPGNAGRIRK